AALLYDVVDGLGRFRRRAQGILVGVDLDGVRRHRAANGGQLRHRWLVVERQGRARGQNGGEPPAITARKPPLDQLLSLRFAKADLHDIPLFWNSLHSSFRAAMRQGVGCYRVIRRSLTAYFE